MSNKPISSFDKTKFVQSVTSQITVDTSTSSASFTSFLTTDVIVQNNNSVLLVFFSVSGTTASGTASMFFRVLLDGVAQRSVGMSPPSSTRPGAAFLVLRLSGVAAGTRTVAVQWRVSASTGRVRPVTNPDSEHASLVVQEVSS